ncbi:MAG TPA: hypothetical protein VNX21_02450, partial [Candidatus Thermoplasmatota archaeon]|nr:hypothetical protein [Candidatus Thermoplasmatota archaeon]
MGEEGTTSRAAAPPAVWRFWVAPLRELLSFRRQGPLALMVLVGAVSSVASGIGLLALPFFLLGKGFTLAQVGALYALVAVGEILVQVAVARNPFLLESRRLALGLLLAASLTWPALLLARSPLVFAGILGLASVAAAAASPAVQVLLARVAGAERASVSYAAMGLLHALGNAVGLVVGGLLLPHGVVVAFYGAAVVSLLGVAMTAGVLVATARDAAPRPTRDLR